MVVTWWIVAFLPSVMSVLIVLVYGQGSGLVTFLITVTILIYVKVLE